MAPVVFFILGGPGSGKGTACAKLVEEFGMTHISAGDLLRDETKTDSELGKRINGIISQGNIVPSEITVELLKQAIDRADPVTKGFLIDGFPRKFDQAEMFETGIAKAVRVYYFDCSEATMESRCVSRAAETKDSGAGRTDDNLEIIRKRFRVNIEQCVPVVEMYKNEGRCTIVDANQDRASVYEQVRSSIASLGFAPTA
eukprot:GILI01017450.1.p1 GENE.GILI01017450.1~~GILI01017450.1.p1  ORF type:complete len:200 (-),score=53.23 GILI01017450.1:58-657(-)